MPFPLLIPAFFFAAWLAMIFWGMVSPGVGVPTIGYPTAMLVTIGFWLVAFPLARAGFGGGPKGSKFMAMGAANRRRERPREPAPPRPEGEWQTGDQDTVNISSSFAGKSRRITSQNFAGGSVNANFGGVQLDLTRAALSGNSANLDVRAFIGGVELYVPEDWDVEFNVSAFLGGVADERSRPGSRAAGSPRLVLSGSATLGGVTVKDE